VKAIAYKAALLGLRDGKRARRPHWAPGAYLTARGVLRMPDASNKSKRVPYMPAADDEAATDWELIEPDTGELDETPAALEPNLLATRAERRARPGEPK
jgi:hypothetical protein